ncbi:MAG: TraX family protein [Lachnospiraceae bacterium]
MEKQTYKGISGSTLKIIALISMFLDHFATIVMQNSVHTGSTYCLSAIGRLAFPIFVFLLVEGVQHTRDMRRYVGRLALFALVSEIPFDLAFSGKILTMTYQNVFWTLLIGALVLIGCRRAEMIEVWVWRYLSIILIICSGMLLAEWMHTDYGGLGVAAIALLYICRQTKSTQLLAGCVAFSWEPVAMLAFIPIAFYNGQRGRQMKYIFYCFYPLHLLVFYGLTKL